MSYCCIGWENSRKSQHNSRNVNEPQRPLMKLFSAEVVAMLLIPRDMHVFVSTNNIYHIIREQGHSMQLDCQWLRN